MKADGNIILFIDEVHNLVGTGDAEGSMNAANILKPALSRGEIQVIGATTFTEYRKYIEKDSALERRFQPVTVSEPSIQDTVDAVSYTHLDRTDRRAGFRYGAFDPGHGRGRAGRNHQPAGKRGSGCDPGEAGIVELDFP